CSDRDRGHERNGEGRRRRHLLQSGVRRLTDSRLSTLDSRLSTTDSRLSTTDSRLPTLVTQPSAFTHGLVVFRLAVSAAAGLLAAAVNLVHGRPRAPLGLAFGHAALLVPFFDVLRLTLFLLGVLLLAAAWHNHLHFSL